MADPCVEVTVQSTGEHVLGTAGEVHLQRCLDDLTRQFARVELRVSEPIVPFRETVVAPPTVDMTNEVIVPSEVGGARSSLGYFLGEGRRDSAPTPEGFVQTANKVHTLVVRASPLPAEVTRLLEANAHLLKALSAIGSGLAREMREEGGVRRETREEAVAKLNNEMLQQLQELRGKLRAAFEDSPDYPSDAVDRIWSFGPWGVGPNVLLNCDPTYQRPSVWSCIDCVVKGVAREHDTSIVNGFQLAALSGPLCEEPMHGVCMVLQQWAQVPAAQIGSSLMSEGVSSSSLDTYGPVSGQLVSAMKEGCRRAFLAQPARLMAAMYSCSVLATSEVLGKLYGVLGRRGGKVCSEEVKEGTTLFNVSALLPVAESFGFAEEMRKKTSGLASPQLVFSHWEVSSSHTLTCANR